jgi:cell division transport system permease protein
MDFFEKLFSLSDKSKNYILVLTLLMMFISIYLVFSTNKLIINSNSEKYETMKLVGAKLSTIKLPIVLNNFLTGLLAGMISFALFYLIISFLKLNLPSIVSYLSINQNAFVAFIFFVGPLLGTFVTIFSLRKITLKIKA